MKSIFKYMIYIVLIFIIVFLVGYNVENLKNAKEIHIVRKKVVNEIPTKEELPTIDFALIREKYKNNDIKGAIRIDNTNFEEIIFQGKNNEYYLTHRYNKKKSSGEIFIDYRNKIDSSKIKYLYISGSKKNNVLINYMETNKCNSNIEIETEKSIYKYELVTIYYKNIEYNNIDYDMLNNESLCMMINNGDDLLIINNTKGKKVTNIVMKRVKA